VVISDATAPDWRQAWGWPDDVPLPWEPESASSSTPVPSLPPRLSAAKSGAAARECLRELDALTDLDRENLHHCANLVAALLVLQRHNAIGVVCPSCGAGMGYCALRPYSAHVVWSEHRKPKPERTGGVGDLILRVPIPPGRGPWIDDGEGGLKIGYDPPNGFDVPGGYPDRRPIGCRRCHRSRVVNGPFLLRRLLESIANGKREFRLLK